MNPLKAAQQQAVSGMELQSRRMGVTAENISNADTPGYKRKLLMVEESQQTSGEQFLASRVQLDEAEGKRDYNPA
ncbi:MAG: flagellar basal-body rod protein, partial [Hyphomonas sp. 32-62-5]